MSKQKIALIDDEPTILEIYSKVLSKEFEIATAYNGKEGLKIIEEEKPVCVLVDIRMPEMDGLEMVKEMKEKGILTMPVIILTNFADDEKIGQAIEMGAKEYILKEKVTPSQVLERVKKVLK